MRIQKLTYKAHKQHLRVEKARRRLLEQILECLEQIERLSNKSGDSKVTYKANNQPVRVPNAS